MSGPVLGFIGLGVLGQPLATRLAGTGQNLLGYDIDSGASTAFAAATPQANLAHSLDEVAGASDIIVTCLPAASITEQVYASLAAAGRREDRDRIWIDVSSNTPEVAIGLAQTATTAGATYVEAPVIGGVDDAIAGRLHILVSHDTTQGVPPGAIAILEHLAAQIYEAGAYGRASAIKALQNALGLIQLNAIAEVLNACAAAGIDPQLFTDIVGSAPGMANSHLFRRVAREMTGLAEPNAARLAIARKDAAAGEAIAETAGARRDMLTLSRQRFDEAEDRGMADVEISRVIEIFSPHDNDGEPRGP